MDKPGTNRVETAPAAGQAHKAPLGLRGVAVFELVKCLLFVVFAIGALFLVHKDVDHLADNIIHDLHLDPAWYFTKLVVTGAAKLNELNDAQLQKIAMFALLLALIRGAEAYGLWHEKAWAEWFAVVSAGVYLPLEITRYWKNPNLAGAIVFLVNIAIVVYLARLLAANRRKKLAARQGGPL